MRLKKIRVPERGVGKWFLANFGIGGADDYDSTQMDRILQALAILLSECGYVELEWIGKFLIKLSDSPSKLDDFLKWLDYRGY